MFFLFPCSHLWGANRYVVLQSNATLEKQLSTENTTYEIRTNVKLGSDFVIPNNCTLLFNGGRISGYHVLTGNNTQIKAGGYDAIFDQVVCKGKWFCEKASICWWGAKDSYSISGNGRGYLANIPCDAAVELCMASSFPAIYFPVGCWYITKTINIKECKDILLAGGPAIKSYYLNELAYSNTIRSATIYTDKDIKVIRVCFKGEEVLNISGGSIDVSQVYLKNKKVYSESAIYFDVANGLQVIQANINTHLISYQDENTFFNSKSHGVLFNISGSEYSFVTDATIACKINGFGTGIETSRATNANKSSWITDLKLNSYIRKARTAIKLLDGDGSSIGGSLQSTQYFDDKGGLKDKDKYPFIDIACRFVQVNASIWDVHSIRNGKWTNGAAIRVSEQKGTYDISESIKAQYGPKKALVLP